MAKTIWKFPLKIIDEQGITLHEGAEFLSLQMQRGQPCLWFLIDPNQPTAFVLVRIYGTGHHVDDTPGKYLGTFQRIYGSADTTFVGHVFMGEG